MLHDETENPVGMVKVREDRLLVCGVLAPDDRKPIAGHDQLWACPQPGDEAVKLFEQHRALAEGEQFFVKLLDAARKSGHGCSNSMAAVHEAAPAAALRGGRT